MANKPFERCPPSGNKTFACGNAQTGLNPGVDKNGNPMTDSKGKAIKFWRCAEGGTCNKKDSNNDCNCFLIVTKHTISKAGAPAEDDEVAFYPGYPSPDYPGYDPNDPWGYLLSEKDATKKFSPKDNQPTAPPYPVIWYTYGCDCLKIDKKGVPVRRK